MVRRRQQDRRSKIGQVYKQLGQLTGLWSLSLGCDLLRRPLDVELDFTLETAWKRWSVSDKTVHGVGHSWRGKPSVLTGKVRVDGRAFVGWSAYPCLSLLALLLASLHPARTIEFFLHSNC